jgi:hypothetical protein
VDIGKGGKSNGNFLMDELSGPTKLMKTLSWAIANDSPQATYKAYRELYQLGDSVIPAIEAQLLNYKWDDIEYGLQLKILSGLLSLVNDLDEERARELGEKIREKGCDEAVNASIKSILNFSLDDFKIYPINGVTIYQSKSLGDEPRIKKRMAAWLSMVPKKDLKEIERLYLIPTHEKYSGTYMPILSNIMVVWDMPLSYYNPLSYFLLLRIENTLYHEIGHHVHRHTFGQDPEQEKEADRYAVKMLMETHPIFSYILKIIIKTRKILFGKRKARRENN